MGRIAIIAVEAILVFSGYILAALVLRAWRIDLRRFELDKKRSDQVIRKLVEFYISDRDINETNKNEVLELIEGRQGR